MKFYSATKENEIKKYEENEWHSKNCTEWGDQVQEDHHILPCIGESFHQTTG